MPDINIPSIAIAVATNKSVLGYLMQFKDYIRRKLFLKPVLCICINDLSRKQMAGNVVETMSETLEQVIDPEDLYDPKTYLMVFLNDKLATLSPDWCQELHDIQINEPYNWSLTVKEAMRSILDNARWEHPDKQIIVCVSNYNLARKIIDKKENIDVYGYNPGHFSKYLDDVKTLNLDERKYFDNWLDNNEPRCKKVIKYKSNSHLFRLLAKTYV